MEIEPRRSQDIAIQLTQVSTLPDREWVEAVTQYFPDIVTPDVLTQDFQSLDQLGDLVNKERRNSKIRIGIMGGLVIGAGALIFYGSYVDPVNLVVLDIKKIILVSYTGLLVGTMGFMLYAMPFRPWISNMVKDWNGRGQTWVQQQRERLSLKL